MQLVFSIIDDLYIFVVRATVFPVRTLSGLYRETLSEIPVLESTNVELGDIETVTTPVEKAEEPKGRAFKKIDELIAVPDAVQPLGMEKNTVMYAGTSEVPVYTNPTQEFDAVVGELGYGDMVMVLEQKGRWARIVHGELSGWMLREHLVDRAAHVYPKFIIGERNEVEDPNTIRIRAMLDDMFGGAKSELPLQAGEYVSYRLMRKGLSIKWPAIRPRTPGLWHTILKGVTGIHIGIAPKTGSIMEFMLSEEIGHLAYVEAVFPDETINISEANYPDGGIYNERVLTREEWRELKPIFIQIV